jgi:ABC-type sugar transport system ATPase subunit
MREVVGTSVPQTKVTERSGADAPLLTLSGINKRFGGVHALRNAHLTVSEPGIVQILIGQNGSGKSTMLGILSGQIRADSGVIDLHGVPRRFASPVAALAAGIALVSQERAVAPDLSVAENVLLGRRQVRDWRGIRRGPTLERAREVLARLELDYDPRRLLRQLAPDQQQMVEIARALASDASVLVLDEPTSSLTDDEVDALFRTIRRLKTQGVSILFVSHRLPEIFEIGDHVTVLRDGETAAEGPISSFDTPRLVHAMVGEVANGTTRPPDAKAWPSDTPALKLTGFEVPGVVRSADLTVRRGEIVGLSGLVGAGRSELLEALFGARPYGGGHVELSGRDYKPVAPRAAIEHGLGFLPADRKEGGVFLGRSVRENLTALSTLKRSRWLPPSTRSERDNAASAISKLGIKVDSLNTPVGALSGGNQQKVALGKWLCSDASVLLLDEPTRGVDVAAKADIRAQLRAFADSGAAILVSSSENEELLEMCNRIIVMVRGRTVAEVMPAEVTEPELVALAGGHE